MKVNENLLLVIEFCIEELTVSKQQVDNSRRNNRRSKALLSNIRGCYARILSIRIDLYYKKPKGKTVYDIAADKKRFIRRLKNDPYLNDYIAYFWVIEKGPRKGPHCHFLFIYNGREKARDGYIGSRIGEHWVEATNGEGGFHLVNISSDKQRLRDWQCQEDGTYVRRLKEAFGDEWEYFYEQTIDDVQAGRNTLGIGRIERGDDICWVNLSFLVDYMTKLDQGIPASERVGVRTFGRSTSNGRVQGRELKRGQAYPLIKPPVNRLV